MKTLLPRAVALLGLSLGSALGGCVHINNTYTGMPGGAQQPQTIAQTTSGRDCGCPAGPAYSDGTSGSPYPVYYPQPYAYNPPSSDRYIYVPYGYPTQGYPAQGGGYYYPRPNGNPTGGSTGGSTGGATGGGTGSAGVDPRPVDSNPRRPDSGTDPAVTHTPTVGGGAIGGTVGINPNLGTPSTPRGPRAEAPHNEEVRPNFPVESSTRPTVPVATTPERDTRPRTETPVATGDRASAPHDVTVRPNIPAVSTTSTPARDTRPATGGTTDAGVRANPDRDESRTPVRTTSPEPPKATTPAQGESVSPAAGSAASQPRRTSGSAATTAPVNSGASAQPVTVNKAETAAPAEGTGSQPRRESPSVKDADNKEETVAPAAPVSATPRERVKEGSASERATATPASSATAAPATSATTAPATSAGAAVRAGGASSTAKAADPVARPRTAGSEGLGGFTPSVGTPAGSSGAGTSSGAPR